MKTLATLLRQEAHLIGVCGGMITLSSSSWFFFGVLSTCALKAAGDSKHLFLPYFIYSW